MAEQGAAAAGNFGIQDQIEALRWVQRNRAAFQWVEKGMGVMLIVFAILIATGGVSLIADAMIRWFPGFAQIG